MTCGRLKAGLLIAALLTAGLLFWMIFSPEVNMLQRLLHVEPQPKTADVIVAFSAGKLNNCKAHPNLFTRELHAADLLSQGFSRSGKLIVSGIYTRPERSGITLRACRIKFAQLLDIPPQSLIIDNTANNTYMNATHSQAIMARHHWKTALLVTSETHLFRASKVFENQGVTVYPDSVPDQPLLEEAWFDTTRMTRLMRLLYEYGALLKYTWYGYI